MDINQENQYESKHWSGASDDVNGYVTSIGGRTVYKHANIGDTIYLRAVRINDNDGVEDITFCVELVHSD